MTRPKLNPTHLQTFAAVAETGSLTQAGLWLDLGQSAIFSQMRQLQRALGTPLYRRTGHGVRLTDAGQELLPYAREVARQVRLAEELLATHHPAHARPITLGVCLTLGETLPPLLLQACQSACPDLHLDVVVAPTAELGRAVARGELLLAFAGGTPPAHEAVQVGHAATDHLVWVPPYGEASGPITLREAARTPWLWAHGQSTVKSVTEQAARQENVELPPSFVLGSYAAVRQGVLSGLGGAFLPRHHLMKGPSGEVLIGAALRDVDLRLSYQMLSSAAHHTDALPKLRQVSLGVLDEVLG